jgi:hypothetical protein
MGFSPNVGNNWLVYIYRLTLPPLKTKFCPQNQSPKTTYLTLVMKSSIGYSPMVSTCLTLKTCLNLGVSTTCVL